MGFEIIPGSGKSSYNDLIGRAKAAVEKDLLSLTLKGAHTPQKSRKKFTQM